MIIIKDFKSRLIHLWRQKVKSKNFYLIRAFFSKIFFINKKLMRVHSIPKNIKHILILGRSGSLSNYIKLIDLRKIDLIIAVNECDHLLEHPFFNSIIKSNKPLIQYLNVAEPVHSLFKVSKLNLWGFWLSVSKKSTNWRAGAAYRKFRGPESLGATPRFASYKMLKECDSSLTLNSGLLCIIQAIVFHRPKFISIAGFDFYKNKGNLMVNDFYLKPKDVVILRSLSNNMEQTFFKLVKKYRNTFFYFHTDNDCYKNSKNLTVVKH